MGKVRFRVVIGAALVLVQTVTMAASVSASGAPAAGTRPSAAPAPVPANTLADVVEQPRVIGAVGGEAKHAAAAFGDYALTGYGLQLHVWDLADTSRPVLATTLQLPGPALAIATDHQRAYVAAGPAGLLVLDLADPPRAHVEARSSEVAPAEGVALSGSDVVLSSGSELVVVRRVAGETQESNQWRPIGRAPLLGRSHGVAVSGDRAFVAVERPEFGAGSLQTIDISIPDSPRPVVSAALPGLIGEVATHGEYVYVGTRESDCDYCAGRGHLVVFEAGAGTLTQVGRLDLGGGLTSITLRRGYLYASGFPGEAVQTIDVADPSAPRIVSTHGMTRGVGGLAVGADWILAAGIVGQVFTLEEPSAPRPIGAADVTGGVAIVGTTAYVASAGLVTIDVTDAANPRTIGRIPITGIPVAVAAQGPRAFVQSTDERRQSEMKLTSVDLSDPHHPEALGELNFPGHFLATDGGVAVATNLTGSFMVVDGRANGPPVATATLDLMGYPRDVDMSGNVAIVAGSPLQVVDISDLSGPQVIATIELSPGASRVDIEGSRAVVVAGGVLFVVDLASPTRPEVTGPWHLPRVAWIEDIVVQGDTAYVLATRDTRAEVLTVDLASTTPRVLARWVVSGGRSLSVDSGLVGVAGGELVLLEARDPASLRQAGSAQMPDLWSAEWLALSAARRVVADDDRLLYTISDGPRGVLAATELQSPESADAAAMDGDLLHAARYDAYGVYLMSEPDRGSWIGGVAFEPRPNRIRLGDAGDAGAQWAYVSAWGDDYPAFRVLDVASPNSPTIVGRWEAIGGSSGGLDVEDGIAYVAETSVGLRTIDVRDPVSPTQLAVLGYSISGSSVAVAGDVAYLAAWERGLEMIDVTDPRALVRTGGVPTTNAVEVQLAGNRLYLADGEGGLRVFDVAVARQPRLIGRLELGSGSYVGDVDVLGRVAYLSAGRAGVVAVDLGPDLAPPRAPFDVFMPAVWR